MTGLCAILPLLRGAEERAEGDSLMQACSSTMAAFPTSMRVGKDTVQQQPDKVSSRQQLSTSYAIHQRASQANLLQHSSDEVQRCCDGRLRLLVLLLCWNTYLVNGLQQAESVS